MINSDRYTPLDELSPKRPPSPLTRACQWTALLGVVVAALALPFLLFVILLWWRF